MTDVMLDLETIGNGKYKCIVQIGACYFSRDGDIGRTFKCNVDAETHTRRGGEIDAKTVYWWLSQDKLAQESILKEGFIMFPNGRSFAYKNAWHL